MRTAEAGSGAGLREVASGAALARDIRARDRALRARREEEAPGWDGHGLPTRVAINEAVGRLQALGGAAAELIDAAPAELCRSCGFSRAMLSRVSGSTWIPEALHGTSEAPASPGFEDYVRRAEISLTHALAETEMLRRGVPIRVGDARRDARAPRELAEIGGVWSYVAAPIVSGRRVIGFLHADRRGQDRAVSVADRDALAIFTDHFGLLFERTVIAKRLEQQRARVHDTLTQAARAVDALCARELELARREGPADRAGTPGAGAASPAAVLRPAIAAALTPREQDVLRAMLGGGTNADIARQLSVGPDTVKTHVAHILRKLRVGTRTEAVALNWARPFTRAGG